MIQIKKGAARRGRRLLPNEHTSGEEHAGSLPPNFSYIV